MNFPVMPPFPHDSRKSVSKFFFRKNNLVVSLNILTQKRNLFGNTNERRSAIFPNCRNHISRGRINKNDFSAKHLRKEQAHDLSEQMTQGNEMNEANLPNQR